MPRTPPKPRRRVIPPVQSQMGTQHFNKDEETTTGRIPPAPPIPFRLRSISPRPPPVDDLSGSETSTGANAGDNGMITYREFPDSPVSYLNSIDDVSTSELSD